MKAFLLAAGYGMRLRPLTNEIPKCLLKINGKPLLYLWLELLEKEKIEEVLINSHYYTDKVEKAIMERNNRIKIKLSFEKDLLGSGGTIRDNHDFVKGEENFFIIYADNLTNVSLTDLLRFHLSNDSIYTTYVYKTDKPTQKGIYVFDKNTCKALEFEEKPDNPKSDLANAGIGVLNNKIFNYFDKKDFLDFGKDVLPRIVKNTYVLKTDMYLKDIGTIEDYNTANIEWEKINTNL